MYISIIITIVLLLIVVISVLLPLVRTITIENVWRKTTYICGIPQVLYRTHTSFTIPRSMYFQCHKKWQDLNPNLRIEWYDNKTSDKFIEEQMPLKVFKAYRKLKPGAFKADLWRACILYRNGGVYADSYCTPVCSLRSMFRDCINHSSKHQFISIKDRGHAIHQGFIACTPNHPFMKQYINDIVKNVEEEFYGTNDLQVTGPICLNESIKKVVRTTRTEFREDWNMYGDLSFFLYKFVYGPHQNIYKGDCLIMRKKFSFLHYIYKKLICRKTQYVSLWRNRNIYN